MDSGTWSQTGPADGVLSVHQAGALPDAVFHLPQAHPRPGCRHCDEGTQTIWGKWRMMPAFEDDLKRNGYWFGILANHSRNLSRKQQREWTPASHQLDCDATERSSWRDPAIEALFKDEQFRIYRAIAQVRGRSRDVMSLRRPASSSSRYSASTEARYGRC